MFKFALDLDLLMKCIFHVGVIIDLANNKGTFLATDYLRHILLVGSFMLTEIDFSESSFVDDFILVNNIWLNSFFRFPH